MARDQRHHRCQAADRRFGQPAAADAGASHAGAARALLANLDWLELGNRPIPFLPATETLLHLIVHSVYEHHFDNGPQVLHDVAVLLADGRTDWPRFWHLAGEGGWTRGCQLLLRLTEHHLGPQPVAWGDTGPPQIPADILDMAALMMLQDSDRRQDLAVQLQLGISNTAATSTGKGLLARVLAPRHVVAAYAGISPDRRGVWLHYPAWLLSRLARTLRGRVSPRQQAEVARAVAIAGWLAPVSPPPESAPPPSPRP